MTKLRICTEHFSEDMIKSYGVRRNLIENAIPNKNLPLDDNDNNNDNTNDNIEVENIENNESSNLPNNDNSNENSQNNQNLNYVNENVSSDNVQNKENLASTSMKRNPLVTAIKRRYIKQLNKKKAAVKKLKKIIKQQRKNNWEDITKNMNNTQRIFLEMILRNRKYKSQVCLEYLSLLRKINFNHFRAQVTFIGLQI